MAVYNVVVARRFQAASSAPTFTEIEQIKPTALSWRRELDAPGLVSVSTTIDSVDATIASQLRDLSVTPCELRLYRDGTLVHAGPITTYKLSGRVLTLSAPGLLAYLQYMLRTSAYTTGGTAIDQATIVKSLIDTYQAQGGGNFGLDTGGLTATGVTRNVVYNLEDFPHLDQVIKDLGASDGGFDYDIEPGSRRLLLYSPRRGTDRSASIILDGRVINDVDYGQAIDPGSFITSAAGVTIDANGLATLRTTSNASTVASFGLVYGTTDRQDQGTAATVDAANARLLADAGAPVHTITPTLRASTDFLFTEFDIGDVVAYDYDAGLGRQTFNVRIKAITMTLDGDETFALEFV